MKLILLIIILIGLSVSITKAQSDLKQEVERSVLRAAGGMGSTNNDKVYKKVIQLIDTNNQAPLANHYFNIYKNGMILFFSKTDNKGYGIISLKNSNYYNKVELDINPNSQTPVTEAKAIRNAIDYTIVSDSNISFPSKKEVIDTIKVYVKKQ